MENTSLLETMPASVVFGFPDDEERLKIPGVLEAADSQRKPKDARPKEDAPTTPTTQQPGSHLPQQFRAHQGHNFQQGYPPHSSPAYPFPGSNIGMSPADTQRMIGKSNFFLLFSLV